jgi:hypothetical protein
LSYWRSIEQKQFRRDPTAGSAANWKIRNQDAFLDFAKPPARLKSFGWQFPAGIQGAIF